MSRLLRWAPPGIWAGFLLFLGTRPGDRLPAGPAGFDKLAHVAFYAVLGALTARASRRWAVGLLAGLIVGTLDEWLQSGTTGRAADALDVVADVVGAGLGGWVYLRTSRSYDRS